MAGASRTRRSKSQRKAGATSRVRPMGFLSYATFDDEHNGGWISDFCRALSGEVRAQSGKPFPIFQDRKDVKWGQNWRLRIDGALETATFLFPMITPNFLGSAECKREFRAFLAHERHRKRKDLIFPIHFIHCKAVDEDVRRGPLGLLVRAIKSHQMRKLIDLRFEKVADMGVRKFVAQMATDVCDAIDRVEQVSSRLKH